jgi:ribosomal protein L40E
MVMPNILFVDLKKETKDVCSDCGAINPSRCDSCRKCLEHYMNFRGKCRSCMTIACQDAQKNGHDVCYHCLTIDPERCSCGQCLNCYGNGVIFCKECSKLL